MQGPCEHCGNKDKSKWLSQCLYKGNFPSRRAFQLSTSDPPCAGDAYAEGQRELHQSRGRTALFWFIAALVLMVVGRMVFHH